MALDLDLIYSVMKLDPSPTYTVSVWDIDTREWVVADLFVSPARAMELLVELRGHDLKVKTKRAGQPEEVAL